MSGGEMSRTRAWWHAIRPHTKPASAAPVLIGSALVYHDGLFALWPAVAALLGAMLIQAGTDLANDYYDDEKGVDTDDSPGYVRVSQSGLIPGRRVFAGAMLCYGTAFLLGIYLVYVGGLPIVVVGLASLLSGFAYSGGPYPIGYHGLGDLFTFVFFGILAVTGTYYVQASAHLADAFPLWIQPGTVPLSALVASLPMAGLVTNILVVNNIRDIEDDARGGKRTLAVILGYRWSRVEYLVLVALAYVVPFWFYLQPDFGVEVLLPLLSLPVAAAASWKVLHGTETRELNPALEQTGQVVALYGVLFATGMMI